MTKRGRPTIGDAKMTAKERRQRWDAQMRNADGAMADQPSRTPVVVYLSEPARVVLKSARVLTKEAALAARTDSEVIEEALRLYENNVGDVVNGTRQADVLDRINFLKSEVAYYSKLLLHPATGYDKPSLTLRKRWYADTVRELEAEAARPDAKVVADLARDAIERASGYFLQELAIDMDALRRAKVPMEERERQLATRVCSFLDLVLGVSRLGRS